MNKESIDITINAEIVMTSGFDEKRDYLGMSSISSCPRRLYDDYFKVKKAADADHRNAWRGYIYENVIRNILIKRGYCREGSQKEIVAYFDDRFRGHTDGETTHGDLFEIKSMKHELFLTTRLLKRIPSRHYDQVQCYMRFGNYDHCFVIIMDTETSEVEVAYIKRDDRRGAMLEEKAKYILSHIIMRNPPPCECGKCQPTKEI